MTLYLFMDRRSQETSQCIVKKCIKFITYIQFIIPDNFNRAVRNRRLMFDGTERSTVGIIRDGVRFGAYGMGRSTVYIFYYGTVPESEISLRVTL